MATGASAAFDLSADDRLVLLGSGKMGGALLQGWLEAGIWPGEVAVLDPDPAPGAKAAAEKGQVRLNPDLQSLCERPARAVVLAVKPQILSQAAQPLAPLIGPQTLVISVAAGKPIAALKAVLPGAGSYVRVMPNTPAAIGRGVSGLAGEGVSEGDRALATALMEAVGGALWVDREDMIDAVTAVSGSGPAYVFYLCEAMAQAGVELGLPEDTAQELARLTVAGAGELLYRGESDAAGLREAVTSPKGTTWAALQVLMAEDGLQPVITKALRAARDRARELAD